MLFKCSIKIVLKAEKYICSTQAHFETCYCFFKVSFVIKCFQILHSPLYYTHISSLIIKYFNWLIISKSALSECLFCNLSPLVIRCTSWDPGSPSLRSIISYQILRILIIFILWGRSLVLNKVCITLMDI